MTLHLTRVSKISNTGGMRCYRKSRGKAATDAGSITRYLCLAHDDGLLYRVSCPNSSQEETWCKLPCYFYQEHHLLSYPQIFRRKWLHPLLSASLFLAIIGSLLESHAIYPSPLGDIMRILKQITIFIKLPSAVLPTDNSSKTVPSFRTFRVSHYRNNEATTPTLDRQPARGRKTHQCPLLHIQL